MKRVFTLLICTLFLLSCGGSSWAVEKKSKDEKPASKTEQKKPEAKPADKKPAPPQAKQEPKKKYDDFVDKNKNGIDDRRENLKKKPSDTKKPD